MRREWTIQVTADSNHLMIDCDGVVRVGSTWVQDGTLPPVDLICDPAEEGNSLLKDALVALIERL